MLRATKEQLEAIVALQHDRNFQTYVGLVADAVEKVNEQLVMGELEPFQLVRVQGMARFGTQLLQTIAEARAEREKYEQRD